MERSRAVPPGSKADGASSAAGSAGQEAAQQDVREALERRLQREARRGPEAARGEFPVEAGQEQLEGCLVDGAERPRAGALLDPLGKVVPALGAPIRETGVEAGIGPLHLAEPQVEGRVIGADPSSRAAPSELALAFITGGDGAGGLFQLKNEDLLKNPLMRNAVDIKDHLI